MKLAIIGYGNMGKAIEKIARTHNFEVVSTIDPGHEDAMYRDINQESMAGVDVCIDFTHPEAVYENVKKLAALKKNMVIGTTGWDQHFDDIRLLVKKADIGFIHASNFSLGVNMFYRMVRKAAQLINKVEEYDIYGYESHHHNKRDSPSGTAKSLANILLRNIDRKTTLQYDRIERKPEKDEIHFASIRAGNIPGTHAIGFDSAADTIELKHTARSREGFALGAVKAAAFIQGKKGFYNVEDLMDTLLEEKNV